MTDRIMALASDGEVLLTPFVASRQATRQRNTSEPTNAQLSLLGIPGSAVPCHWLLRSACYKNFLAVIRWIKVDLGSLGVGFLVSSKPVMSDDQAGWRVGVPWVRWRQYAAWFDNLFIHVTP